MEHLHTRDLPGPHLRAQMRDADLIRDLRAGHLPNVQRGVVIEYVEAAFTADQREELGGARFLERAEQEQAERLRVMDASVDVMTTCVVPGCRSPQDVHFGAVCGRIALCHRHSVVWKQVETEQAAGELLEDGTTVRQWIETQLQARQTEGA